MGLHKNLSGTDLHDPKGVHPTPAGIPDDEGEAYKIHETGTTNNYILISTSDSAESVAVGNTTTNPQMVQLGTGNVGLGTDSPQEKLHVHDGNFVLHNDAGGSMTMTFARDNTGSSYGTSNKIYQFTTPADMSKTTLQVGTAGSTTDAISVNSDGVLQIVAEVATPADPGSGNGGFIYVKSDGKLYFRSNSVSETDLSAAGSASAQPVLVEVHNDSGAQIDKGKAVYVSGEHASGKPTIALADADGSGTMPAIGIVYENIANGADGNVVATGPLSGLDTSSFTAGNKLYVSDTPGALTATRPTAAADKVQNIGFVTRSHASAGSIAVIGSGRSNDIPNDLVDLTGVSLGAEDLGTFTGSTITDNSSIKTAFQELETSLETKVANPLTADLNANGSQIKFNNNTGIEDEAGNNVLIFAKATSAINNLKVTNAATGGEATASPATAPIIDAITTGSDTDVDLGLRALGTGTVTIMGNTNSGTLTLNDEADTNCVHIKAPAADDLVADYTLTLPINDGDSGEFLQTNGSGVLSWAAASGGGGLTVESQNSTTALTGTNKFVKADSSGAAITLTLPAAATAGSGAIFVIKDIGNASSNAITLEGNASETIDGALNKIIATNYASIEVVCDGSNWWIR